MAQVSHSQLDFPYPSGFVPEWPKKNRRFLATLLTETMRKPQGVGIPYSWIKHDKPQPTSTNLNLYPSTHHPYPCFCAPRDPPEKKIARLRPVTARYHPPSSPPGQFPPELTTGPRLLATNSCLIFKISPFFWKMDRMDSTKSKSI